MILSILFILSEDLRLNSRIRECRNCVNVGNALLLVEESIAHFGHRSFYSLLHLMAAVLWHSQASLSKIASLVLYARFHGTLNLN